MMADPLAEEIANLLKRAVVAEAEEALDMAHPLVPWLVDWSAVWNHDTDDADRWLLEPVIPKGRAIALYAGAKTGKSWVVLYLAACLATGRAVFERPRAEPVDVLYVDFEMSEADLADRLRTFGFGPGDDLSHLHYVLLPSIRGLDIDKGGEVVVRAAQATGAQLVVIDTTARAVEGEENDADTIRAFHRHTGLPLKALGCAWMRLDHAGKDVEKGQRGTSGKNDDVDLVLRLERIEGGVVLKATHRRIGWYPEKVVIHIDQTDDSARMRLAPESERVWHPRTVELAGLLDSLGEPVETTKIKAGKALREHGVAAENRAIGDAVAWRKRCGPGARTEISLLLRTDERTDSGPEQKTGSDLGGPGLRTAADQESAQVRTEVRPTKDAPVRSVASEPDEWEEF